MPNLTRRRVLLCASALPAACVAGPVTTRALGLGADAPRHAVRGPAVDQSWRYAQHDAITGAVVAVVREHIASIGEWITVAREAVSAEATDGAHRASWGARWLALAAPALEAGSLPAEVQQPWGMVLVDPHWDRVQVYRAPLPLWPVELRPGWRAVIGTEYRTPGEPGALPWRFAMHAHDWETVTVPAGTFTALRYTTWINYSHSDFARVGTCRQESAWFAPEVGRWVARETAGLYYVDDSINDQPRSESAFRWELLDWS